MTEAAPKNCPVCKKPATDKYRPFCSSRCADIDLGRWLTESYALPAEEAANSDLDDEQSL